LGVEKKKKKKKKKEEKEEAEEEEERSFRDPAGTSVPPPSESVPAHPTRSGME
jgi:hypothetical protein